MDDFYGKRTFIIRIPVAFNCVCATNAGWLSRNSVDAATSCSPFSAVLTWWANHRQLLEWMDGWLARNGTTNELQLNNDNLLHGKAFSGQCNLLAQHGVVAQWPSRQTDRTGRMAKVQEDVQRSKENANCLWNIKHLSNKIYFWKECLCVNMNLCSVLPLPCQDEKDKRNRHGLFANVVVVYWFPYSRNSPCEWEGIQLKVQFSASSVQLICCWRNKILLSVAGQLDWTRNGVVV